MDAVKTILLIDDDIDDQEIFMDALKGIENAVVSNVAYNGREALTLLKNMTVLPDIIFSDIHMPIMNGIDCITEIRKSPHTKNIPVIVLSSNTEEKEIVFGLGVRAFVEKTAAPQALHLQIEQLLASLQQPGSFGNKVGAINPLIC